MGFIDKIFGKKKTTLYSLNELGRNKAQSLDGVYGVRLKIVNYLDEHDSSSISEISNSTGLSTDKVKIAIDKLLKEQWITPVKNQD